ncbi:MAG TPA: ferredoxin [Spongiibacteraceae bacterium]|nr:ferredoxin [Spongiibacteraceae bacterium]
MTFRIFVDRDKCENNGYCMRVAQDLIRPAADGSPLVVIDTLDAQHIETAHQAVAACPMNALRIDEVIPVERPNGEQ